MNLYSPLIEYRFAKVTVEDVRHNDIFCGVLDDYDRLVKPDCKRLPILVARISKGLRRIVLAGVPCDCVGQPRDKAERRRQIRPGSFVKIMRKS